MAALAPFPAPFAEHVTTVSQMAALEHAADPPPLLDATDVPIDPVVAAAVAIPDEVASSLHIAELDPVARPTPAAPAEPPHKAALTAAQAPAPDDDPLVSLMVGPPPPPSCESKSDTLERRDFRPFHRNRCGPCPGCRNRCTHCDPFVLSQDNRVFHHRIYIVDMGAKPPSRRFGIA